MMNFRFIIIPIVIILAILGCKKKQVPKADYANEMRQFVIEISEKAKSEHPDFIIIPQNGNRLTTISREQDGIIASGYLAAIDGLSQEDLYYGYKRDDKESPSEEIENSNYYLNLLEENGKEVLVTDYCSTLSHVFDSYSKNEAQGYISFAATERNLTNIPDYTVNVHNENSDDIYSLSDAKNYLYLINPSEEFSSKVDFLNELKKSNYDVLIIDRDIQNDSYTKEEIASLKVKENGGRRLVISYMSIGEAEDYRSYWKKEWEKNKTSPDWLYRENKKWRGNYKVFYWMEDWKKLIYRGENSYLQTILDLEFDGAFLDVIDAYEYYEEL